MPVTRVTELLTLLQREPGRPRVTWYGDRGERIELSGAVLENWVSKTANLLVEELDAGPGTRVLIDLPVHWRTVVWALAVWRVGACVVLPEGSGASAELDVVVTDRPAHWAEDPGLGDAPLVAVTLPALARRFDGPLPDRAIDAASAVMTYGDVIGWAPATDPTAPALDGPRAHPTHADLVGWSTGRAGVPDGSRSLLVTTEADRGTATTHLLGCVMDALRTSGSVVVVDAPTTAELTGDAARRTRLVESERVTAEIGPFAP